MHRCFCWLCGLIALLIVCVAARGQATQPSTAPAPVPAEVEAENLVEYANPEFGFRLEFPDWLRRLATKQPPGVGLVLLRPKPDPAGTQAQIMVVSPPEIRAGLGLEESARVYLENFGRAFTGFEILDVGDGTLGAEPAKVYLIKGNQLQGGREVKMRLVLAFRNDRLYSLIAIAEPAGFDSLLGTFERVVESFRWTR